MAPIRTSTQHRARMLAEPGWNPRARRALEALIRSGSGKGLPVVFDFDNTIVCGDIGEAMLAVLARRHLLTPSSLSPALCPQLRKPGRGTVRIETCSDVIDYYEALLAPTVHAQEDPSPLANGYLWATQALEGLTLEAVLGATREAFECSIPGEVRAITVTPGKTAFPAPFFYPEMVELIGVLLQQGFAVWIVSASNVWSVRWMVAHGLNPALRRLGYGKVLPVANVVGVATLVTDSAGGLHKDAVLARKDPEYAALAPSRMRRFRVTREPQFPLPIYSGKVGCIFDALGRAPFLCVGDSPTDHPMLAFSRNRLWIQRLEKPDSEKATRGLMKRTGTRGWIWQWVRTRENPGFIYDHRRS